MTQRIPIIVGVGEFKNASRASNDAIEPVKLMVQAITKGLHDMAISKGLTDCVTREIDLMSVVASSTWPYEDLPRLICDKLGSKTSQTAYSSLTGNSPVQMIDDTAQLIAKGGIDVGVVVGGEAFASLKSFIKSDTYPPPWTPTEETVSQKVYYANDIEMLEGVAKAHRIGVPSQVYALYENAFRAYRGQTILENHQESSKLYAQYAKIAADHPMAWNHGKQPETEISISTVNERNRMICFPYPLLMNAFNDVNLAAACIMTSVEYAERLGIPREKWIYPLGAGRADDSEDFWTRPNFHSSPAIGKAIDMALKSSGLNQDEIDIFDFYSCFPIVPKLACRHLGIPLLESPRPITLLGGLTSFGGAGADYSLHATAEMVRRLRQLHHEKGSARGFILANGGVLTHENAICLSSELPEPNASYSGQKRAFSKNDQDFAPPFALRAEGKAIVETYTVEYDRQNKPKLGHIVCRMAGSCHRVIANHGDNFTLRVLSGRTKEPIGLSGFVRASGSSLGQNLFYFPQNSNI